MEYAWQSDVMTEQPLAPSSVARAIERSRLALGTSVRHAADLADISEGRWRQIAKGYQQMAGGYRAPVNAPAETLARMCSAVRLSGEELRRSVLEDDGAIELAEEVAALVDRRAPTFPYAPSILGDLDDPETFRARAEDWFMALQTKIESLELEVEDLRAAIASSPGPGSSDREARRRRAARQAAMLAKDPEDSSAG